MYFSNSEIHMIVLYYSVSHCLLKLIIRCNVFVRELYLFRFSVTRTKAILRKAVGPETEAKEAKGSITCIVYSLRDPDPGFIRDPIFPALYL